MPVAQLLVEGELDEILLVAVRPPTAPQIIRGGNKGSLAPKARERRKDKSISACYVRDRDFDHEPPADLSSPSIDSRTEGGVLGWRWCRHEIENYLLEPSIVSAATGWDESHYTSMLIGAAQQIVHYSATRWLLGQHRQLVDKERLFKTRPFKQEIRLPDDLSAVASVTLLLDTIHDWEKRIARPSDEELRQLHTDRANALLSRQGPGEVLLWHSGKDLLAGLTIQIDTRFKTSPKGFLGRLRDWIRDNPALAMAKLPEWSALFRCVAAEP